MENKKWIRFTESFILLPIIAISSVPVGPISQVAINVVNAPLFVSLQKQNIKTDGQLVLNDAIGQKLEVQKIKAQAIDAYFKARSMPLEGLGMKMVVEAEKNDLDWRLLPAIAIRESSGGKNACNTKKNNSFGWGSCRIGFNSVEESIETVARNLGGNNPKTAKYYDNKTTKQILRAYNPPSIVPRYAEQVISIMNAIGRLDAEPTVTVTANT